MAKKKDYYIDPVGDKVPARHVPAYDQLRDQIANQIAKEWLDLEAKLASCKQRTMERIDKLCDSAATLAGCKKLLGGPKGNIQFRSFDSRITVSYEKPKRTEFDERLQFAQDLMLQALRELIAAGNAVDDLIVIVTEHFRPRRSGSFDRQKIRDLRKIRNVKHDKWQQALRILDDCERTVGYREYVRVSIREGKDIPRPVLLDIAKV